MRVDADRSEPARATACGSVLGAPAASRVVRATHLVRACHLSLDDPIIDVTGVDSDLMEVLLGEGYRDLTVVESSESGYADLLRRCAGHLDRVNIVKADLAGFHATRRYALWHDAGMFHTLIYPEERRQYLEALEEALRPEGYLVIGTFGPEGPEELGGRLVCRYSSASLALELGSHFELAEHSLSVHHSTSGQHQQYLHCRFRRHAPTRAA